MCDGYSERLLSSLKAHSTSTSVTVSNSLSEIHCREVSNETRDNWKTLKTLHVKRVVTRCDETVSGPSLLCYREAA